MRRRITGLYYKVYEIKKEGDYQEGDYHPPIQMLKHQNHMFYGNLPGYW